MKLLILSDIHGSYKALEKVFSQIENIQPDKIILLGDILYHGPRNDLPEGYQPKKCIELLNQYKDKILSVRGNCDAEVDQMVLQFHLLSDYIYMNVDGYNFFITHGHLYDEDNVPYLNENDVYIYGHFHKPVLTHEKYYKVNPNSISLPKQSSASYLIYEDKKFVLYDLNHQKLEEMCLK